MDGGTDRYEPLALLGSGGMGEVRLCKDVRIGREIAVKVLRRREGMGDEARRRFLREARVQGQLEHPSVIPVYDLDEDAGGEPRFTMRRVRGVTLKAILAGLASGDPELARFSRRKLLTALVSVCLAAHYAHTRGVIHRDIKPSNVMLGEFGEVYVLDWGVAKLVVGDDTERPVDAAIESTRRGRLVGTPAYMAPEQLRGGDRRADARTDVYALGVVLFEVLTLRPLHEEQPLIEAVHAKVTGQVDARPSRLASDVPAELDAICLRATSLDPADRYPSPRDMADAIEKYLDGDREVERRNVLADAEAELPGRAQGKRSDTATPVGSAYLSLLACALVIVAMGIRSALAGPAPPASLVATAAFVCAGIALALWPALQVARLREELFDAESRALVAERRLRKLAPASQRPQL